MQKLPWLLKMAWRDSRRGRSRLFLFISSIILGIAALVAINSFNYNLKNDIENQAQSLLGADLSIEGNHHMPDSLNELLDEVMEENSTEVSFSSMVLFPKNGGTRLSRIRAMEGSYPYYGKFNTAPEGIWQTFQNGRQAIIDKTLAIQYDIQPGDSVRVGDIGFEVIGQMNTSTGQAGFASAVAPSVYIPKKYLPQTNLIQMGSRVDYLFYYKIKDKEKLEPFIEAEKEKFDAARFFLTTVERRKRSLGKAFGNMNIFLNMVGFIALLLGCIGVAGSVHVYIKDKLNTVAILRCLGVSGRQAFLIYLFQILTMGLLGAFLGVVLGSGIQVLLPMVLQDFLPIENVSRDIAWEYVFQGMFIGVSIAVLFALLPLLDIRRTSPLRTLRSTIENLPADPLRWLVYGLIGLFVFGFAWLLTRTFIEAFVFSLAIGFAFLLLTALAKLVMFLVKRFFPTGQSYTVRQAVANLYRPNNQTLVLIVTIGLGTTLISMLFFTQDILLNQVELSSIGSQPNMILFDIQPSQKEGVADLAEEFEMPVIQQVPIVTMRLESINGENKKTYLADTVRDASRWVFDREYRVTYRDTLIDTEEIIKGEWHGDLTDPDNRIPISLSDRILDDLQVDLGDEMTFNVQGIPLTTYVSSIRKVDFRRVQTNFFVVFPTGVLEKAPQFHVLVTRTPSEEESAKFQQSLVTDFPNVSAIDLTLILKTAEDLLNKVSFVIQFMALFSILTGLLVLISSVVISKFQRIKESVLLRTLGASKNQIRRIAFMEYLILGSLATLTGIILALIGSYLLAVWQFELIFIPSFWPSFIVFISITILTILIGLFNLRDILNKPPLEVLRTEV